MHTHNTKLLSDIIYFVCYTNIQNSACLDIEVIVLVNEQIKRRFPPNNRIAISKRSTEATQWNEKM